jgi:nucleotide-binding universal stress UspA family protein
MGYQKILIPLDGSEFSEVALRHVPLVAAPGARIHLMSVISTHVAEALSLTPEMWEGPFDTQEETRSYLKKVADPLTTRGYKVTVDAPVGPVVPVIAEASKQGFDLIIVATHRRSGFGKFILGSVSERLLHETHCPMLIV